MPKADVGTIGALVYLDDIDVTPIYPWLQWISKNEDGDVFVFVSMHHIASAASGEAISLSEDSGTVLTILWDPDTTTAALTIKTNSDSDARAVKPLRILSGALSALTVSNSDSAAHYLGIARIVISDTTNVVLKEVSDAF